MIRARSFLLAAVALAAGCASEYAPELAPVDLPPANQGRVVLGGAPTFPLTTQTDVGPSSSATNVVGKPFEIDLATALAVAGARSVLVRLAQAKEDEAQQAIYAAWGTLVPTLAPGIDGNLHHGNTQSTTGQFELVNKQYEFGGAGAYADWAPGTVAFKALAAARRTDAAHAATETARADNALAVAEAYYALVRARALVRIAEQALQEAHELEHDEDAKERRGAGIKADVLRAQAEVAQRELQKTQAEAEIASASARLAALLQLVPDVELVPAQDMPVPIVLVSNEVSTQTLLDKAAVARPELLESRNLIDAAVHDHEGVKWGPLVPQAQGGLGVGHLGGTFGASAESNDFGAAVGWRIGPGGLFDIPAINAAAARVRQARVSDEGLKIEIARQVVDARASAVAADKEVASARNGVTAAVEALRLQKERFVKGAGIELEVLDAARALERAQTSEVEAIVDLNRAQYRLLRAIGDPIETAGPK
jgi:outer membrane protein TolC